MEKNQKLIDLMKDGVAIVCHSGDEVIRLGEMIDCIYHGYGQRIWRYTYRFGQDGFEKEMAVRLETRALSGLFDYGCDKTSYYKRLGYQIVNFSDLDIDLGELEASDEDIWSFLICKN